MAIRRGRNPPSAGPSWDGMVSIGPNCEGMVELLDIKQGAAVDEPVGCDTFYPLSSARQDSAPKPAARPVARHAVNK